MHPLIELAALLLERTGLGFEDDGLTEYLVDVVASTTIVCSMAYVLVWRRQLVGMEPSA